MAIASPNFFRLRHALSPSLVWVVMIGSVDVFLLFVMLRGHQFNWNIVSTIAFLSAMSIFIISLNLRYTITWDGAAIVQTAFGLSEVSIKPDEITKVRLETSDVRTLFKANRPYNRIAIYAGNKFIDVSMKHFKLEDIRKLMAVIRETRPDLPIDKLPKAVI